MTGKGAGVEPCPIGIGLDDIGHGSVVRNAGAEREMVLMR